MTDKEIRRLKRKDLLEMLIEQQKENMRLRAELEKADAAIQSREIVAQNAGTMADAALSLNKVYEATDAAAKQYLENIKMLDEQARLRHDSIISEAEQEAARIIARAEESRGGRAASEAEYALRSEQPEQSDPAFDDFFRSLQISPDMLSF